ncbi:probable adenylate kinase 7, mitochondrial [Nymphaea colorata]|nr:probable adenylate kinase 7, mitochondrial [Nymphaea colorata]
MAGILRRAPAASRAIARLAVGAGCRPYGAAAALELSDDEDGWCCDRVEVPTADSPGIDYRRGVQWVFIGNPGVEKSAYAGRLARLLSVPHISMGSLVRSELVPSRHGSLLSKQIANALNEGKLLPDNIILGLLSKRLEQGYYRGETGFILDGFPRTRIQAEILDHMAEIDLVVNFKCTEDCLVKKHLGSCICLRCIASDRSDSVANSQPGIQLSSTCQAKMPANVAKEAALQEKLRVYIEERKPLEEYYGKRKKLLDIEVAKGTREVWHGLLEALQLEHMDRESQKLTA